MEEIFSKIIILTIVFLFLIIPIFALITSHIINRLVFMNKKFIYYLDRNPCALVASILGTIWLGGIIFGGAVLNILFLGAMCNMGDGNSECGMTGILLLPYIVLTIPIGIIVIIIRYFWIKKYWKRKNLKDKLTTFEKNLFFIFPGTILTILLLLFFMSINFSPEMIDKINIMK